MGIFTIFRKMIIVYVYEQFPGITWVTKYFDKVYLIFNG